MRVLWEIQRSLSRSDMENPGSTSLIMPCMLGYPSLRVSRIQNCHPISHFNAAGTPATGGDGNSSVAISIDCSEGEASEITSASSERDPGSGRYSSTQKYCCNKIDIVGAPQPLHILFHCYSVSKKALVEIRCDEGQQVTNFCWQNWKDGFMGRLWAQSEWRSKRLLVGNEKLRQEPVYSKVNEGISKTSESRTAVTYWKG